MSKEKQIDLVDKFRSELMHKFIDLCRGNDYNKLTLLKIGDTVDQIFDKQIKDILVDEAGYRKQSEGEWLLEREPNGKPYCFHCSVCDGDFHHIGIRVATKFCPNCGAKMKGGAE